MVDSAHLLGEVPLRGSPHAWCSLLGPKEGGWAGEGLIRARTQDPAWPTLAMGSLVSDHSGPRLPMGFCPGTRAPAIWGSDRGFRIQYRSSVKCAAAVIGFSLCLQQELSFEVFGKGMTAELLILTATKYVLINNKERCRGGGPSHRRLTFSR